MNEAYIIDGIRTPIGSLGGSLSTIRTDDLAALVIKELIARNPRIPAGAIDDVIPGCHNQALQKAGLRLRDIDIIELNEAFAAQSIACIREHSLEEDDPRINPNGGAIAFGHPLGMSGARIIQTAAIELYKQNKRYALATMCIGVGQGYATIIERV